MSKYQSFIFKDWSFDKSQKKLELKYSYDNEVNLTEIFEFNFDFADYSEESLERAISNLFFMAGVSYYKAFLAPEIKVEKGVLDKKHADFFSKTYQKGLGEFFYVNQLNPRTEIKFPVNSVLSLAATKASGTGMLIGLGGGKDSLVSIELLRDKSYDISTWSVGHKKQLEPLSEVVGLPHYWVSRSWDPQLMELNKAGAYNGHVPISAILACVGTVAAVLGGKRDIVVSNEKSADEPTLHYEGLDINHQYSKSSEFEEDYQEILVNDFGETQRYYSLLRSFSELKIAEMFAEKSFDKYKSVFSSCNRAFTKFSDKMFWCGQCPKCAFIFLIFTPFIQRDELEKLFGKNLLLDPSLDETYKGLLGIEGDKPLECVGEIKESRSAMLEAQKIYPELTKYKFEVPSDYDFRELGPNNIPADIKI